MIPATRPAPHPSVIVSNGHGLFHMRLAAAELAAAGRLDAYLTAGYPTARVARLVRGLGLARTQAFARLLDRAEAIPHDRLAALWLSEPLYQGANAARILPGGDGLAMRIHIAARALYAWEARRRILRMAPARGPAVYHYRAGYGHGSVAAARARGYTPLCDHSIAHPAVLQYIIEHDGALPPKGEPGPMNASWASILADIGQAPDVVVNSDFVRDTFTHMGWPEARVHVVYLGVDDRFIAALPARAPPSGPLKLLFAGAFNARKGAADIVAALARLDAIDWRLEICGPIDPAFAGQAAAARRNPRVRFAGNLSRRALASRMAAADVFVFPSRAEGSARVVFEALAAGCYVITTRNAGSIVEDGVHGAIIAPGDVGALVDAIEKAAGDRARTAAVGAANAALVARRYRQSHYGEKLARVYAGV